MALSLQGEEKSFNVPTLQTISLSLKDSSFKLDVKLSDFNISIRMLKTLIKQQYNDYNNTDINNMLIMYQGILLLISLFLLLILIRNKSPQ
jgi:hypothetical protein